MSIVQNQIRTGYILLATIADAEPAIYDEHETPLFNLGDSYYNSLTCLIYTVIRDSEDSPMYWGSGTAPLEGHIYLNKALGIFYGVNNGELFANIGTVDLTNPMHVNLDMDSHKLLNVANGTSSGDAVNKGQLDLKANISDVISVTEKGIANGVATLDASGKVPSTQLALPIASTSVAGVVRPDGVTITASNDGVLSAAPQITAYTPDLLDVKWSDHLLNNLSWLRGDTFSWQSGVTYSSVYNELLDEFNDPESVVVSNEEVFVQPTLDSDGIMGGSSFACSASSALPPSSAGDLPYGPAYYAFDGNNNTAWHGDQAVFPASITFYSPYPLKATSITITNWSYTGGNTGMTAGLVEGSNDNSTWSTVGSFGNTDTSPSSSWDILLPSNTQFYKYYRITCLDSDYNYAVIGSIRINGTYINTSLPAYTRTPKGYKIVEPTQEQNVINAYNLNGVSWYYILDTTNTRFKLPRTKFSFTGLRTGVGDYVAPGLPNITGKIGGGQEESQTCSGAFYSQGVSYPGGPGDDADQDVYLDASRSSSIYGNSNTVQPPATQMYLYFYVSQYSQSAYEQTAGLNAELFNNKADISLNNVSLTSGLRKLIEIYKGSDGYWYKVFAEYNPSNGNFVGKWCEQGGVLSGTAGWYTVTYLKPFVNNNYFFSGTAEDMDQNLTLQVLGVYGKATTGIKLVNTTGGSAYVNPIYWKAEGYIE